jgi:hypothetical protein
MTPQFVTFSYMASMFGDLPVVGFVILTFATAYFIVWYAMRPPMRTSNYCGKWWHSSGSDKRFQPQNEAEEYAYAAGLRDAIRIADDVLRVSYPATQEAHIRIGHCLHARAKLFESDGSETVNSDYQYRGKFFNRKIPK